MDDVGIQVPTLQLVDNPLYFLEPVPHNKLSLIGVISYSSNSVTEKHIIFVSNSGIVLALIYEVL